jgi:hypothetical protein
LANDHRDEFRLVMIHRGAVWSAYWWLKAFACRLRKTAGSD